MNKKVFLLGVTLLVGTAAHANSDSVRAELEKLRLVNLKCATVTNNPFDDKHLNCYTNVFNKASQIGNSASKFIDNEEAPRVLAEHNQNYSSLLANCDQLYGGNTARYKTLAMQCKATNKLGWAMFIPAIMR